MYFSRCTKLVKSVGVKKKVIVEILSLMLWWQIIVSYFTSYVFFYVGEGMADAVNTMINGTNTINIMCYIFHIQ